MLQNQCRFNLNSLETSKFITEGKGEEAFHYQIANNQLCVSTILSNIP